MKTKQPSIRQLEYFITVARASNFRKAALRLGISQPTLTSQIAALEETLGVQLFERSRAGTLLSAAGRELLPQARKLLEQYQQLLDRLEGPDRELTGTFRVGVDAAMGPWLLPRVLPVLRRRYPGLRLYLREGAPGELEAGLDSGDHDLILSVLPLDSSEFKVRPLFIEALDLVMPAGHPLAQVEDLNLRDLYGQEVLCPQESRMRRQLARICEGAGARLLEDMPGNSLDSLRQMALIGMGMAFLPALYLHASVQEDEGLCVKRLREDPLNRTHVAVWRRNAASRHLFQKLSYDIKSLALERFGEVFEEVKTEENPA